ncbi:hypothetical protein PIB30_017124 [Stylosanthes scabra]|uniref:Uncharacterized protein n=1 Tax=Stylosanthes scabra TaxID=79078 RepID=A0ABU6V6F8_9FABA|nr:hypothetical protein [Stylosanthes scabra]
MTDSRKSSNKIRDIVRLQQILKKWKNKAANHNHYSNNNSSTCGNTASSSSGSGFGSSKGIKFLKRTLSLSELSSSSSSCSGEMAVPKGCLAVSVGVGSEVKRFVIPTEYLRHEAFEMLLRQAEEEFGFQQEGVLRIPCQLSLFHTILDLLQCNNNNKQLCLNLQQQQQQEAKQVIIAPYASSDCQVTNTTPTHPDQMYCT